MTLNRPPVGPAASPDLNALSIHQTWDGRTEAVGQFSLALESSVAATTTQVSTGAAARIRSGDFVLVQPLTANARVAYRSSTFLVPLSTENGQFTVTHPSSTLADRAFAYIYHGR